jgi:ABC-type transport system substrate-binding protein
VTALWFDQRDPPMNDPLVREAVAYAIDRASLVRRFVRPLDSRAEVVQCGLIGLPSTVTCPGHAFSRYHLELTEARGLLGQAGYDCSQPTCVKDGHELTITIGAWLVGGSIDENIEEALLQQLDTAGFFAKVDNPELHEGLYNAPGACPWSGVDIFVCGVPVQPTLDLSDALSCTLIPPFSHRSIGWCNAEAASIVAALPRAVDPTARIELLGRLFQLEADDTIGLPLFVDPVLSAWRVDKLAGPVGAWANTPYGFFFNAYDWTVAG